MIQAVERSMCAISVSVPEDTKGEGGRIPQMRSLGR